MNKIIVIGYMSMMKCYLNVSKEEAIGRYIKSEDMTRDEFDDAGLRCDEVEFDDEFEAYDIWN